MKKRALVTGGAGFIGGHFTTRLLAEGFAVDVVDDMSRGVDDALVASFRASPDVRVITADLRDPKSLAGLDDGYTHVVHFAALLGVQNVLDRPYAVLRENVAMLETALDLAARQPALERFVFPSTSEVYVGTLQNFELPLPTPESTPLAVSALDHPRTSYMLSKIYGEALVQHAGLPFTIIRPHNVYGPRMGLRHVVPELLSKIHRLAKEGDGGELEVASPEHSRTFCYVDDAVELFFRLMTRTEGKNGTFNVGIEAPEVSILALAEKLAKTVGHTVTLRAGAVTPGSPSRRAPHMAHATKAAEYTGRVSLDEGLARTYAWYRDHVFEGKTTSAK